MQTSFFLPARGVGLPPTPFRRFAARALCAGLALLAAGPLVSAARAQSIYLRDGQVFPTQGLHRDGETIVARIQTQGGGVGDIGYAVASIARIDFPEPPQLKLAGELLSAGRAEDAIRQLTPILAYYAPFHDVAGNWWTPLALLQVDAFARVGRGRETDALINDLVRFGGANPDTLRTVRIKQAVAIERRGDHRQALSALEALVKDPLATPESLTEAWLAIGSARLALRDYRPALLAFLHIPVYSPDRALLMPAALLGSANAYVGLDDGQRAEMALKQLVAAYPNTPEAAQAKDRLQKLAASTPKPTGG